MIFGYKGSLNRENNNFMRRNDHYKNIDHVEIDFINEVKQSVLELSYRIVHKRESVWDVLVKCDNPTSMLTEGRLYYAKPMKVTSTNQYIMSSYEKASYLKVRSGYKDRIVRKDRFSIPSI